MELPLWTWGAFIALVLGMLALDLGVFHKKAHKVSVKEAAIWSGVWVALSMVFALAVYLFWPDPSLRGQKGVEFLTGYLIEKSLSIDNIFVFVLIFTFFKVPALYQHRVLFWGVFGAIVMRAIFIGLGATLVKEFQWILYIFGAFLVFTGYKLLFGKEDENEGDLSNNKILLFLRKRMRITEEYHGQNFFVIKEGLRYATPLFLVLVLVEITDLIFAVDSIPAIFAVTQDTFIVFTSNILAILGLRSMYFLLADIIHRFVYLKTGLAIVLAFIGVKLLLLEVYKIPTVVSLGVVIGVLTISIVASLMKTRGQSLEKPAGE
jgi:tellurite resistance protein TerC